MLREYITNANIECLEKLMEANSGFLPSKLITDLGFNRHYLKILEKNKTISKIDTGIYVDTKKIKDKYFIISLKYPSLIFSHETALFLNNFSKETKNINITTHNKYNNSHLKGYTIHYISKDLINIGKTPIKTPLGNIVYSYDLERTICDIIKSRRKLDTNIFQKALKKYIKFPQKNIENLKYYAKSLKIERLVNALIFSQNI